MTKSVSVAHAKAHLSQLLQDVEARGAPVVVARRGKPIAVIRPFLAEDADPQVGWFDALYGALADEPEFGRAISGILRSRRTAGSRAVDLED
jgi:prevent-host-death family protein